MIGAVALRWLLRGLCVLALALCVSLVGVGTRGVLRGGRAAATAPQLPEASTAELPAPLPAPDYAVIPERALFAPQGPSKPAAGQSERRLELLGTVYTGNAPERSLAVVRDLESKLTHVVGVGTQIGAAQVLEIQSRALLLSRGNATERLELRPPAELASGRTPSNSELAAAAMAMDSGAADFAHSSASLQARTVEDIARSLAEPAAGDEPPADGQPLDHEQALHRLTAQVRFVPRDAEGGGLRGVWLRDLDTRGSLWRAGFREGDLVIAVAGHSFTEPGALESLRALPLDSGLSVDVEREGESIRIEVDAGVLQNEE